MPEQVAVDLGASASTTALVYERQGPSSGASLIFAHGAGAGQRSPFIVSFAEALAGRGITVVTFNFPYIESGRRLPDRAPVLDACYRAIVDRFAAPPRRPPLFIGGKSMGGRIATHIAAADSSLPVDGIICLGYPLHPPGRPAQRRDAHLPDIRQPMLIVQGSADEFGTPDEFASVVTRMDPAPALHVIPGGDHSFKVRGAGKAGTMKTLEGIYDDVARWIGERTTA